MANEEFIETANLVQGTGGVFAAEVLDFRMEAQRPSVRDDSIKEEVAGLLAHFGLKDVLQLRATPPSVFDSLIVGRAALA